MKTDEEYLEFDEFCIIQDFSNGFKTLVRVEKSQVLYKLGLKEEVTKKIVKKEE